LFKSTGTLIFQCDKSNLSAGIPVLIGEVLFVVSVLEQATRSDTENGSNTL
jgi:hypothetical protein